MLKISKSSDSDDELKKEPIYPPDRNRALVFWAASFASFCYAAAMLDFFLIVLTGIAAMSASALVGEQLYKSNVYKEILYHRALSSALDVNDGNGDTDD
jgi:hypothetical protein